jgi:hypothetical protein
MAYPKATDLPTTFFRSNNGKVEIIQHFAQSIDILNKAMRILRIILIILPTPQVFAQTKTRLV